MAEAAHDKESITYNRADFWTTTGSVRGGPGRLLKPARCLGHPSDQYPNRGESSFSASSIPIPFLRA
jgi:hypothetical protein